ncbi:MAG: YtxH domain-containing protein [Armatimonadota bacterium]|nr:MAG: YtxH domain-containing protein [Armatimonadota bacterium]
MSMKTGDFLAGVFVGALIGASLGLLFAPEPGEGTRERVMEKGRKLKDAVSERGRAFLQRSADTEEES